MGIERGEEIVLPSGVEQGPSDEGKEGDVEGIGAEGVDVLGEDAEGARDAEDGEGLGREAACRVLVCQSGG